jgi:hypothetical protein
MLYLLDANVLVTAKNGYYGMDMVPQFWTWLIQMGQEGRLKIPKEIFTEITDGNDDLAEWAKTDEVKGALVLEGEVTPEEVQAVLDLYGEGLDEAELEEIGEDPFLIAYAQQNLAMRTVVTNETSKPTTQRANRRVPDICKEANVLCCTPVQLIKSLGFKT